MPFRAGTPYEGEDLVYFAEVPGAIFGLIGQNQDLSISKNAKNYVVAMIFQQPMAKEFLQEELERAQQRLLDADKIHFAMETTGPPSKRRMRVVMSPKPEEPL